jgi:hypothetical protein
MFLRMMINNVSIKDILNIIKQNYSKTHLILKKYQRHSRTTQTIKNLSNVIKNLKDAATTSSSHQSPQI